jgi:glycosyltransferase involved in cell wall biosynthesis
VNHAVVHTPWCIERFSMRFSVLLPTRNGGAYLENCIMSILEQNFKDFELVISDNANTDQTKSILSTFSIDPRIRIVSQKTVLSVSENWTAALHASIGEYVLMMGDDDYLLPHALSELDKSLKLFHDPDCVLFNGYSYVSPGAISNNEQSYWAPYHYQYDDDFSSESVMSSELQLSIVKDMFKFKQRIPLNMQTSECGDVFVAPFPDHYLLNALLTAQKKWIFSPKRLVVVGVSPKSFGHYFYSQSAQAGLSYLGINTHFAGALPGSELLNGMYSWLLNLKKKYPDALHNTLIDEAGYVRRQVYSWILQKRYGGISNQQLLTRFKLLTFSQFSHLCTTLVDFESWRRLFRLIRARNSSQAETLWHGLQPLPNIANIREFSSWLLDREIEERDA